MKRFIELHDAGSNLTVCVNTASIETVFAISDEATMVCFVNGKLTVRESYQFIVEQLV